MVTKYGLCDLLLEMACGQWRVVGGAGGGIGCIEVHKFFLTKAKELILLYKQYSHITLAAPQLCVLLISKQNYTPCL